MNGLDRYLSYQGHVIEIEFATGHTGLNKTIICHQTSWNKFIEMMRIYLVSPETMVVTMVLKITPSRK